MPKSIVIVVEGNGDETFLKHYISNVLKYSLDEISIVINGGKKFRKDTIKKLEPHIENYLPILVIIDADDDGYEISKNNALATYNTALACKQIKEDQVFVFPNNKDKGCLESLLLSFIKINGSEITDCLENFTTCLRNYTNNQDIKNPHSKYVLNICLDILLQKQERLDSTNNKERNYPNKDRVVWNWQDKSLEPLNNYLKHHFQKIGLNEIF